MKKIQSRSGKAWILTGIATFGLTLGLGTMTVMSATNQSAPSQSTESSRNTNDDNDWRGCGNRGNCWNGTQEESHRTGNHMNDHNGYRYHDNEESRDGMHNRYHNNGDGNRGGQQQDSQQPDTQQDQSRPATQNQSHHGNHQGMRRGHNGGHMR